MIELNRNIIPEFKNLNVNIIIGLPMRFYFEQTIDFHVWHDCCTLCINNTWKLLFIALYVSFKALKLFTIRKKKSNAGFWSKANLAVLKCHSYVFWRTLGYPLFHLIAFQNEKWLVFCEITYNNTMSTDNIICYKVSHMIGTYSGMPPSHCGYGGADKIGPPLTN